MKFNPFRKRGRPPIEGEKHSEWLTIPMKPSNMKRLRAHAKKKGVKFTVLAREDVLDGLHWRDQDNTNNKINTNNNNNTVLVSVGGDGLDPPPQGA